MKHTKGPWKVCDQKNSLGEHMVQSARLGEGLNSHRQILAETDNAADAHLVAAAPEMLAAMEAMIDYIRRNADDAGGSWAQNNAYFESMTAAVRKAKGLP